MTTNTIKRGLFFSGAKSESQPLRRGQQERKWTVSEMEEIVRQERVIRQQAQLAAEQALTAAKEAQKMILQLEEELEVKDQQLQQARVARKEVAAEKVVVNALSTAVTAKIIEQEICPTKCDVTANEKAKSPKPKRSHEDTQTQSLTVSKKHRRVDKGQDTHVQCEDSRQKMSLAEARKAAQEEVEKRIQARANEIETRKSLTMQQDQKTGFGYY